MAHDQEPAASGSAESNVRYVPSYHFGTTHLRRQDQFEAWTEITGSLAANDPPGGPKAGFEARLSGWNLGQIVLAEAAMPPSTFSRVGSHLRMDPVDQWWLSAPKSGYAIAENGIRTGRGQCRVRALHRPFRGKHRRIEVIGVFIPRDFLPDAAAAMDQLHEANMRPELGALLSDYLMSLQRQLPSLQVEHLPAVLEATRAIITACAVPDPDTIVAASTAIHATQVERARQLIRRQLLSPELGVDELCRSLGVSRSSLYRSFEPLGGVMKYIRSARLLDAHQALTNSADTRTIHEIAAERGFMDPGEFSRAFRREFGYSPSDARARRLLGSVAVKRLDPATPTFADLLRGLGR